MGRKAPFQRKDRLYEQAKSDGYRSRAAYKLQELDKRFHLLRPGMRALDLGAWPGGWLQVASERLGSGGLVIGIDRKEFDPFRESNIVTIQGDLEDEAVLTQVADRLGGLADLVLSDMSPNLTGIKEADRAQSQACCELALFIAQRLLRPSGNFVAKTFKSNEAQEFIKLARQHFESVKPCELDSTRDSSNEFYVVGLGYKGTVS